MPAVVMRDYRGQHDVTLGGKVVSGGTCEIHLEDAFLLVKGERVHRIAYEEIESVRQSGGTVELGLHPEGRIAFRGLDGAMVRPLFLHLSRLRGTRWADLLRFVEGDILDELECKFALDGGREGEAIVRLYPAALVVLPIGGEPFQLGLHETDMIQLSGYRLRLGHVRTPTTLFGGEPGSLRRFHESILRARQGIEDETVGLLSELFPALEFAQMNRLTTLLLRGKATSKRDIDAVVPWLWEKIEDVVRGSAKTAESYAYLRKRAGDQLWFGLRRLTELEKRDVVESPGMEEAAAAAEPGRRTKRDFLFWFMAGIPASGSRFLAVEIAAGTTGYATYVYRALPAQNDEESFGATAQVLSRTLVALNFHREPLYASEREIETGEFARYKLALRKLDYLRTARSLFVGRAIHTAAWETSLEKLMSEM